MLLFLPSLPPSFSTSFFFHLLTFSYSLPLFFYFSSLHFLSLILSFLCSSFFLLPSSLLFSSFHQLSIFFPSLIFLFLLPSLFLIPSFPHLSISLPFIFFVFLPSFSGVPISPSLPPAFHDGLSIFAGCGAETGKMPFVNS